MEIRVKSPTGTRVIRQELDVNREEFQHDIIEFVSDKENKNFFNEQLYQKILDYGVEKRQLDKMVESLETYSSYEENTDGIGFPYENWIPQLLEYYTITE